MSPGRSTVLLDFSEWECHSLFLIFATASDACNSTNDQCVRKHKNENHNNQVVNWHSWKEFQGFHYIFNV